ncbi:MAG: hypothetical protein Q8R47_00225 [Nanoarchaeota archaeon]|nr:hypothetical protein [Nanoarchaeota archaeon]
MMLKKRGFLIVVVLVILLSFSGLAGWSGHCNGESTVRCVSLVISGNDPEQCGACDDIGPGTPFRGPINCDSADMSCQSFLIGHGAEQIPLTNEKACIVGGPYNIPPSNGCWVIGGEEDVKGGPADPGDDCSAAKASFGNKWGQDQSLGNNLFDRITINDNPADADYLIEDTYIKSNFEYVCSDDSTWHLCIEKNLDQVAWADDKLYECKSDGYVYNWTLIDSDQDHDGWTTKQGDCKDNPELDSTLNCPVVDIKKPEWAGLTLDGIRDKVKDLCKFPQHSQCAICTNPGAPEVCGDNVNNDCGGPNAPTPENKNEPNGETSDDCHLNQASCTQQPIPNSKVIGTCVKDPKQQCSFDNECKEGKCDLSKAAETKSGFNIYNQDFSWVDTKSGGYCCGFNGVNDLGQTVSNEEGNFLCVNKNMVGSEATKQADNTFKNWIKDLLDRKEKGDSRCGENWCWLNAISAQTKFQIIALLKPGEKPIDVVSNNDEWFICKEGAPATVPEPGAVEKDYEADLTKAHRFYCYDEGNRWALAECAGKQDTRRNFGIKGRYEGEGLFSLPLVQDSTPDVEGDEVTIDPEREGKALDFHSSWYKKFYSDYNYMDFSSYDYFNFMVKFVDEKPKLPVGINLKLYGPKDENNKDIIYFDGEVLGYVENGPLFDKDGYMHVRVPIGDYKAVKSFTLGPSTSKGAAPNVMKVRNIYLSKEGENPLCSGQDSIAQSSWLNDTDFGDPDKEVDGKNLCTALYGKTAWLGSDQQVDAKVTSANCCGNNQHEYYAGKSAPYPPQDAASTSEAKNYGCWNSQPIASGETIMNVEFQVSSIDSKHEVTYDPITLENLHDFSLRTAEKDVEEPKSSDDYITYDHFYNIFPAESAVLQPGQTFKKLYVFNLTEKTFLPAQVVKGKTSLWFKDIGVANDLVDVFFYDTITGETHGKAIPSLADPNSKDGKDLLVKEPSIYLNEKEVEHLWGHPLAIVMQLEKKKFFPPTKTSAARKTETTTVTDSCSSDECLLSLPGNPPYKITNLHPDLYELYFVTGSLPENEKLITQKDQQFAEYGNLKARKVAQQVIFHNGGDDAKLNSGFYGCNAADFIGKDPLISSYFSNKQYCSAIDGMFCALSVQQEAAKQKFTTIDSWSDEKITNVGYEALPAPEPGVNISAYYEQSQLKLKLLKVPISPEKRNHTAVVLPARNFISNPEFATVAKEIPHWELFDAGGNKVASLNSPKYLIETGKVTLAANEKLRSERLAVGKKVDIFLSQAQNCQAKVLIVDKDGNSKEADLPKFNTDEASYVVIEFTGPCQVEKPSLQVVDELGPADYSYQSHMELADPDARSGAACCPDGYCWNGYACVEPMSSLTTTTEHVADGRDYRCVDGGWKRSALKFDWNNKQWGFCPQESQCFVLGSGKIENTAKTFYQGQAPICINNNEYIFDNYCSQGNWTSRTKFLATKLLQVAENSEYVLYCSPYKEALLDLGNNENYLGGTVTVTEKKPASLPTSLGKPQTPKILNTCYPNLDKGLVPDAQNTCINNVCILQYKEGGQFKVAFATTLNKDITNPNSFLLSLNIPQEKLSQICQNSGSAFIECNLNGLEFPSSANLYYSKDLNALIYARDGMKLSPGAVSNIMKWFKNLFGAGVLAEKTFVAQAQNFRNVYLANIGGKKVRAVEEIFPGVKQSLVAEYQNFDTPICEYVKNIKVPPELQLELLEQASGIEKLHCAVNGTTQKVVINAGLDFFWPQLTGKLRIGESS